MVVNRLAIRRDWIHRVCGGRGEVPGTFIACMFGIPIFAIATAVVIVLPMMGH